MAQGVFPITKARQQLGFTPSTSVHANLDVSTGEGAIAQAIGGVGQSLASIGAKWDLKEANTQLAQYQSAVGMDDIALNSEIENEHDADKHSKIYDRHREMRNSILPKNATALNAAGLWNTKNIPVYEASLVAGMKKRVNDNWNTEAAIQIAGIGQTGSQEKLLEFKKFLARGIIIDENDPGTQGRPLDRTKYNKLLTAANKAQVKGTVSSIKSLALTEGLNERERAEIFDNARKTIQTTNVLTSDEVLKESQSINLLEQQLVARDKRQKFSYDVNVRESFSEKLSADPENNPKDPERLNLDDVREVYPTDSQSDQAEIKRYAKLIAGSNKPNPSESTGKGFAIVNETLLKLGSGTKDKKSAIDDIDNARYGKDMLINDETHRWALKRINNPYEKYLSDMIMNVMNQKAESIRMAEDSAFYTKWEKKRVGDKVEKINIELFKWVDKTLDKDPKHIFTPQEINNMESQIGATIYVPNLSYDLEPKTIKELKENTADLKSLDPERARKYWDKWSGKWQKN